MEYNRPRKEDWIWKQFKWGGESSSLQLSSYNKFYILASQVMQAGILDLEGSESKNDRKTIFKEEKLKKERQEKKKRPMEVKKTEEEKLLRKVMVKISLERIGM